MMTTMPTGDALRAIHRLLFPERYDPAHELYEWSADTAPAVAELVEQLAERAGVTLAPHEQTYPSGCVECGSALDGLTLTMCEGDVIAVERDGELVPDAPEARKLTCSECCREQDVIDEATVAGPPR